MTGGIFGAVIVQSVLNPCDPVNPVSLFGSMALKIKLVEIDGQKRVPPEVMDLLLRLAAHRDLCSQCANAERTGTLTWCATGMEILRELAEQPEVSQG